MSLEFWESRYAEDGFAYGTDPNTYLASFANVFQKGSRVLVIGDGEGRNGVWLAQQGCEVVSVDQSQVGLEKAEKLAAEKNVKIETICADLTRWDWPESEFDVVVIIYVHFPPDIREQLHHHVVAALKTGGQLIMESFTPEQLNYDSGGPPVLEMLYTAEMMQNDFLLAKLR